MSRITQDELRELLRRKVSLLVHACADYDAQSLCEADAAHAIAPHLRVLLHDTNQSTSLLQHLGVKDTVTFYDSSMPRLESQNANVPHFSLAASGHRYIPHLDAAAIADGGLRRMCGFGEWWDQPVMFSAADETLSRKRLLLALTNKDGVLHIDRSLKLPPDYSAFARDNSLGRFSVVADGALLPGPSPIPASVRQIAHEVLVSVALALPRAFQQKTVLRRHLRLQPPPVRHGDGIVISGIGVNCIKTDQSPGNG